MDSPELAGIVGLRDTAPSRACDIVAGQLRSLIVDGQLGPGARLPAERELAQRFQTSRATISQALRVLAALGLVEIRHGSGVYVSPQPARLVQSSIELMFGLNRESMINLVELRGWIEVAAIARAARVRTDADVARIRTALSALAAERSSVRNWLALDVVFHRAIADAIPNTYAATILTTLLELMASARTEEYEEAGAVPGWFDAFELDRLIALHGRIAEAIAAGDVDAARAAALEHQHLLEQNVAVIDPWASPATGRSTE